MGSKQLDKPKDHLHSQVRYKHGEEKKKRVQRDCSSHARALQQEACVPRGPGLSISG
ncbi:hypothetical protein CMEL01_03071 [Colletotrichum melonis]|uniref:Uncharacterized protein n=1 Tax=Colletotrichum melonis TaxID=1209925 RepID=A0AAI9XQR2_9PEZI|nr:hypothetical protein CMEL01_03071 [Colletotrichum melonis]